jgi:peptidoglycan/LPS O-acetylase OafA/YrhL
MKNRVEQLDGLRGIFSIMVIAHHHSAFKESLFYDNFFVINSSLFVDFFFVLSGFVISINYLNRINNASDFLLFVKKRFIRLYPLLFYTEIVMIVASLAGDNSPLKNSQNLPFEYYRATLIKTLTFLGSTPLFGNLMGNNYPAWSISSEMISYLVFGLVVLLFARFKYYALALIMALSTAFIVSNGEYLLAYDYGFVRGLLCFCTGVFTCIFYLKYPMKLSAFEFPFLAVLLAAMYWVHHEKMNLIKLIFPVVFSAGIIIFANSTGVVSRLLASKPFQYLGRISYSIYLNHALVLIFINILLFRLLKIAPAEPVIGFSLLVSILLTIGYSHFTYELIEKRFGKFLTARLKERRGR